MKKKKTFSEFLCHVRISFCVTTSWRDIWEWTECWKWWVRGGAGEWNGGRGAKKNSWKWLYDRILKLVMKKRRRKSASDPPRAKIVFQHLQERKHLTFIAFKDSNWKKWGEKAELGLMKIKIDWRLQHQLFHTTRTPTHFRMYSFTREQTKQKTRTSPRTNRLIKTNTLIRTSTIRGEWKKSERENSVSKNA